MDGDGVVIVMSSHFLSSVDGVDFSTVEKEQKGKDGCVGNGGGIHTFLCIGNLEGALLFPLILSLSSLRTPFPLFIPFFPLAFLVCIFLFFIISKATSRARVYTTFVTRRIVRRRRRRKK